MTQLSRADLWSLEDYAEKRQQFRAEVMAHKKNRQLALDEHARLYFEDRLTVRYQIQEMLRIEKIFDRQGIEDELNAYNPLIPDGCNWKATFMLEYDDVDQRRQQLSQLRGIEDRVWMQVQDHDRVTPIADEDMEREDDDKTASVHFLRYELTQNMVQDLHEGATLRAGIDHPAYPAIDIEVPEKIRASLLGDLQQP
jgi:hypothetical protein